jgi:LysR family nitrogen assimilation transcriptional regulator
VDLRHLRYFAAVAKAGSFTAAARQVNISQPALTYQIKQLEEELKVKLLKRFPRGVGVTDAGGVLLQRAEALLDDFDAIEPALAPFRKDRKEAVGVGMSPTPARALAADLMQACSASGRYTVAIREGLSDELCLLVARGELDCAICYDPVSIERQVKVVPLARERLAAVARPEVFGAPRRGSIALSELSGLPLVLDSSHQASRRLIDNLAAELGIALDIVSASSVTVKKDLITRKGLCTIVPFGLYAEELESGLLEARWIEPTIFRTLSLIFPQAREKPLAALVDTIAELVDDQIADGRMRWKTLETAPA